MKRQFLNNMLLLFLFAFLLNNAKAQPFADEIATFKKQDSAAFPPKNAILFVGSSSFRMWKDVSDYFPGYTIINRGFGGSSLPDVIRYADDIIFPYHPKQIVIYCGENDLAASDTVTGKRVAERFYKLYNIIRNKLPRTPIVFISMKPSPSRQLLLPKMIEGNNLIKDFLKKKKNTDYVDVYKEMVDDEGKPRPELFLEDNLHMNKSGYLIWKKIIEPHLMK